MDERIALSLEAVIVAVTEDRPRILTVTDGGGRPMIPSGPLDPTADPTLEIGLRRWISSQTGFQVGYAEQLYTFGDRDRRRRQGSPRLLSVAYLALVREEQPSPAAAWLDLYELFPWEDHRSGTPAILNGRIAPQLVEWANGDDERAARLPVAFGLGPVPWDPIRVLERYELLYEAGAVAEAYRDRATPPPEDTFGIELALDHRRIAATALGRLRGKLTYRPVVFELLPEKFTLTRLQRTVAAIIGIELHKQNFRRLVERGDLVEGTGERTQETGGRPAELFRFRQEVVGERQRPGMRLPRLSS